jgi:DNA-binding XRE family transcriptional regulator
LISTEKLKQFRLNNGWSQEHLSDISGLGLRTIQRVEKEGKCSLESKMALSSAFAIAPNELDVNQEKPIGSGSINWDGIVGLLLSVILISWLLSLGGPFWQFIDIYSLVFVIVFPFALASISSGLGLTLKTYSALHWFIIEPKQERDIQLMLPVMRRLIVYSYSAGGLGSLIALIAIFSNISPLHQDFWPAMAIALLSLFGGAIIAELAFRPLKHKCEQLMLDL